jgi:hypothetical protein
LTTFTSGPSAGHATVAGVVARGADAAPAVGIPVAAHAAKPGDTSSYRNAAAVSVVWARTGRSNPADHRPGWKNRVNRADLLAGAGPRAAARGQPPPRQERSAVAAVVRDNGGFARGAVPYPARYRGTVGPHASAASAAPPAGTRRCNTVPAVVAAETSAHNP